MKTLFTSLFASMFALLPFAVSGQCVADDGNIYTFFYQGNRYDLVQENKSWADAATCAKERGGFLVEVNTQQEQDSLYFFVRQANVDTALTEAPDGGNSAYVWIGANDLNSEAEWIWDGDNDGSGTQFWQGDETGNPVGGLFNNWGNEPDNFSNQDAAGLALTDWPRGDAGQWNDVKTNNELFYVIEYVGTMIGTNDPAMAPRIEVYPNPVRDRLTIELPQGSSKTNWHRIQLYNTLGAVVLSTETRKSELHLELDDFEHGIYLLEVTNQQGGRSFEKVLLDR